MAVVLIFVLHVQGSCQDRTPDWIVLEDLDAAFHQGCAHLTFSFRDVERSKHVSDLTDALDSSFDESHVIASQGSLAYWGPKEWWRITSEPTAIQFDGTVLTDGPVDLAANKGAFFVHRPTVQLTAERKSRDVFAIRPLGEQTGAFPDIINVQLLEKRSLLEYLQPGVKRGSDFPFEWNQKDGLIEISARDGKLPVTRSLTISTMVLFLPSSGVKKPRKCQAGKKSNLFKLCSILWNSTMG